jgi:hypothetical protein
MITHWSTLVLVYNDAGVVHDPEVRRRYLEEYRASGTMGDAYLTRTWGKHENPKDRRTWGPTRREIDWSGFGPSDPPAPVHSDEG